MLSEKEQFPYSFLIFNIKIFNIQYSFLKFSVMNLLTQNNNFSYFIISLATAVVLFSKIPCLTAHIKINFETGGYETGRCSEKKTYPGPSQHLRWSFLWH